MDAADAAWMRRAIAAAAEQVGRTGDNPAVGCVLVKDSALIALAATADGGRPHAEEQALKAAGAAAKAATAYVTLEPCGQRSGGAPSCAQRLAEAGVARVVVACLDKSPLASGRGAEVLTAAGVAMETGLLRYEASVLYRHYAPGVR